MRIWLIKIGEPVPDGDGRHRLFRTGLIAQILAERGHDVTWWTANFSHQEKRFVGTPDETRQLESNLRLILLRSRGYSTNISWERFADHIQVAARFLKLAPSEPRPDVIACSFPTVELAAAAVRWGRRNGVPVILDLRDLWPEVLLMHMPKSLRGPARLAIAPYFALSEWAFKNADALYAITPAFLQWGLDRASRPARETDRAFWLAYPDREPSQAEIADARAQWADRGVDLSSESFLACYFGSLSGTVDVHLLVRVAEILKQRRSQVRIVICGSGRLLAELQMRAAELASHLS
ncbi:MAG: glycosyltransferase, partial [Mycobacteriales bacterium]